jgi:glyoxylase-like metal-dependent hydrolase (beta-lactamase superfamily II)
MKIIPLSEGAFTIDQTKLFIPFDLQKDDLQQRNPGSLLVEVQPFVIVTQKDIILLDTGLGFETDGRPQIHQNLINAGINPGEVSKILISHLHKDHAGGVGKARSADGSREISFPNATYYVQQKELEFAFEKGFPSYLTDELEVLKNNKQVVLLDGSGMLDGYIRYELTGAHCPYHQVFWIMEDHKKTFFGADVAPQIQQMKNRFIAKYDYDGKKCMELRKGWWAEGAREGWTFLFYHDIKTPIYKNPG